MNTWTHASCRSLIALFGMLLILLRGFGFCAEVRLAVAPRIKLPEGLPVFSEEQVNFFGNATELLGSPHLKARVTKNHAEDLPSDVIESIRVGVTRIPETSILLLKASGADESMCGKYLAALAREFLAFKAEAKRRHYEVAIERVEVARNAAKNDATLAKSLADYRSRLLLASLLDTQPVFELWPAP